jgi:hypothetical protein
MTIGERDRSDLDRVHAGCCLRVGIAVTLALGIAACGGRTPLEVVEDAEAADAAVAACSPATCAGCCDDGGACLAGTEQSACGIGGSSCQACDPRYDVCNPQGGGGGVTGVVCWAPCPLRECAGCCTLGGTCITGIADEACGGPQRVCDDCTSRGMVCGSVEGARVCAAP